MTTERMGVSILALYCALVLGLGGCAVRADSPAGPAVATQPAESESPPDAGRLRPAEAASALTSAELEVWNDPAFRKRFTESYLAETDLEPSLTVEERDLLERTYAFMQNGELDEALALLEKHRGKGGATLDLWAGNIHFQRDKLREAAQAYQAALAKHPNYRRAWRGLGMTRVRQAMHDEAIEALTKVIELGGGDALMYGFLGFAYASAGNDLAAESAYRMAILLDGDTLDWKMGLARSFFMQKRFPEAVSLCEALIEAHPARADLWNLQARAYIGLRQPMKAAENYELMDELGASTFDTLSTLGSIYVNEELYDMAVDRYIRAMNKDPQRGPEAALTAAKVLAARGALAETASLVQGIEAVHVDRLTVEQRKDLLKLRARIAVAEGDADQEAKVLEEIVALDPMDGEALILLGQHSFRGGDHEQAIFYYERAAALDDPGTQANAKVRHAQVLVSKGDYAEAVRLLRQAQALKPRTSVQDYLEQVEAVAKAR